MADLPGLQLMSPLVGDTALAAFTIDGMRARDVQAALLERFGVFTVERPVGDASLVRATVALTLTWFATAISRSMRTTRLKTWASC